MPVHLPNPSGEDLPEVCMTSQGPEWKSDVSCIIIIFFFIIVIILVIFVIIVIVIIVIAIIFATIAFAIAIAIIIIIIIVIITTTIINIIIGDIATITTVHQSPVTSHQSPVTSHQSPAPAPAPAPATTPSKSPPHHHHHRRFRGRRHGKLQLLWGPKPEDFQTYPGLFDLGPQQCAACTTPTVAVQSWNFESKKGAELVVAVAQDGLNRWLNNISTQVSHEGREHQMGWPQHIPGDLPSLRNFKPSWSDLAGEREMKRELPPVSEETSGILRGGAEISGKENVNLNLPEASKM
eukprot:s8220_g3.t1